MKRFSVIAIALAVLLGVSQTSMAQSGNVVFYNAGGSKLGKALTTAFNKHYPDVAVDLISAGSGELLTKIKAEKGNPRGDVVYFTMASFDSDPSYYESFKHPDHAMWPETAVGKDMKYYGFTDTIYTFILNTDEMKQADAPKTWKELGDPKFKGKIIMANPSLSGSAYNQLATFVQLYGWDLVEKIVDNAVIVPKSRLVYSLVAKGEYPVGVTEETKAYVEAAKGFKTVSIYPEDGMPLMGSAIGIIKNAPNMDNAKLLATFINSKEGQGIHVKVRKRRVPRTDVKQPDGLPPISSLKVLYDFDVVKASANRKAYLKKFDEIFSNKN
ncbi:MAG: extracellular solute-binding protein [Candidatus Bipolaricaulota bacterium]